MTYRIMQSDQASRAVRTAELEAAHADLSRKTAVRQIMEDGLPSGPILTVRFGRGIATLDERGEAMSRRDQLSKTKIAPEESDADSAHEARPVHQFTIVEALKHPVKGSAPGNKRFGRVTIPCGVCLIIGPGGVGKTPLAHALAAAGTEVYGVVDAGEPLSGYSASADEYAARLAQAMLRESSVVVDSIKDILSSGKNPMKSGLSREGLLAVSEWSALACDLGTTLFVPLNPSSNDPEVYDMVVEAASSNATSMIVWHASKRKWELSYRTGEGLPRVAAVDVQFTGDYVTIDHVGAAVVNSESRGPVELKPVTYNRPTTGAMLRAIRGNATNHSDDEDQE